MDLNAPLGMTPPKRPGPRVGLWVATTLGVAALVGVGTYLAMSNPHGGEPYAVAELKPPTPKPPLAKVAALDPSPTASLQRDEGRPPLDRGSMENGVKVFRGQTPAMASTEPETKPLVIDVTKSLDEAALKKTKSPSQFAWSKPAGPGAVDAKPRIAIFVSGMGLSQAATRTATEIMPPAVTFAFVPYGDTVAAAVDAAKAKGHEILLQLPMQNARGPAPGPHALKAGEPPAALDADLAWLLGRFNAYTGVTNLLGAPVTSNAATMTAILRTVGSRGLFYVDDGTSKKSTLASVGPTLGVRSGQVDIVLDATSDPSVVRANLNTLVATAKRKGSAIGMASGLPEHMSEIARFAGDIERQGVTLVPVGAIVGPANAMAAAK